MRRAAFWFAAVCAVVAIASEIPRCAVVPGAPLAPRCAHRDVGDASLFLVGDAGAPRKHEALLRALAGEARERVDALGAERVAIVFLGDNVYPRGLRPPEHPKRRRDERRLGMQLDAIRRSGARGFFVPGNHDWSNGDPDGWDAIRREGRYVDARGATMAPAQGCPGPAAFALGDVFELVAVDTQWWLHAYAKPADASAGCVAATPSEAEAALAAALRDVGGRRAIVLAHHPLVTGGPHGVRFGWREHLFPLRAFDRRLWIPLPLLGSIEPLVRTLGISDQDLPSAPYRALAAAFDRAFAEAPPLAFAAGHDHTLQLVRTTPERFQIVSGAGSAPNVTFAYPIDGGLFAAAVPGYVRLDAFAGGDVEIAIRTLDGDGAADAYAGCLTE